MDWAGSASVSWPTRLVASAPLSPVSFARSREAAAIAGRPDRRARGVLDLGARDAVLNAARAVPLLEAGDQRVRVGC